MKYFPTLSAHTVARIIFWGYNVVYVLLISLILLNAVFSGWDMSLRELLTFGGMVPTSVLAMIYAFALTPFTAMILGYGTRLKNTPKNLLLLMFGFEIPLMGLALTRIVFLRQITPAIATLLLGIAAGIAGMLCMLWFPRVQSKLKQTVLMISQQLAVLVTGYAFLLAFFFLPIIIAFFLKTLNAIRVADILEMLASALRHGGFLQFLLTVFILLFVLLTGSFFTAGPIGAFAVFFRNSRSLHRGLASSYGLSYARGIRYGVSFFYILFAAFLSVQVSRYGYADRIEGYKSASTFEQKQQIGAEILGREKEIKEGLVSSYLAQYQYLSDEKMNLLTEGYRNELGTSASTAQSIQRLFNTVALPFIYRGAFEEDVKKSAEYYTALFDMPIQKGELETIAKTLRSTNTQDSLKAGILDSAEKTVRLVSKEVHVVTNTEGLFATVTIEEEYENVAPRDPQEVYYEFSLLDSAVITGLKLGPDLEIGANAADKPASTRSDEVQNPDSGSSQPVEPPLPKVDEAVVAPRGAAQTTYENQIFRRTDPALLAQVGPRQYKLRIFPIPAKGWTLEGQPTDKPQKNQKVQYSYITTVTSQGVPLPSVSEQRNIFTDSDTIITQSINGSNSFVSAASADSLRFIHLTESAPCPGDIFESQTPAGTITFIPHSSNPALIGHYSCERGFSLSDSMATGLHIALLLDASYSNTPRDWNRYLREGFPSTNIAKQNAIDLYYFNDTISKKISLSEKNTANDFNVVNVGKTDRAGALAALSDGYDLVIMVTDDSVFDATSDGADISTRAPVYIVHPEGKIPPYNDALTNAVLQSGGEVVETESEALMYYWLGQTISLFDQIGTVMDIDERGTWVLLSGNNRKFDTAGRSIRLVDSRDPLGFLAKKRVIMHSMREAGQSAVSLSFLDRIHRMSEQSFIVTPYSSMIVLVTDAQKRQLAEAATQNNRYRMDIDTGEEQLGDPSGRGILEIGAVPEPHEWLLMLSSGVLLAYFYRSQLLMMLQPLYERMDKRK